MRDVGSRSPRREGAPSDHAVRPSTPPPVKDPQVGAKTRPHDRRSHATGGAKTRLANGPRLIREVSRGRVHRSEGCTVRGTVRCLDLPVMLRPLTSTATAAGLVMKALLRHEASSTTAVRRSGCAGGSRTRRGRAAGAVWACCRYREQWLDGVNTFGDLVAVPAVAKVAAYTRDIAEDLTSDQLWALFDRDQDVGIPEAFREAAKAGVRVAFSNPSFDLWSRRSRRWRLRSLRRPCGCAAGGR